MVSVGTKVALAKVRGNITRNPIQETARVKRNTKTVIIIHSDTAAAGWNMVPVT